ncbi:SRPBCC family protein [Aquibacillus sediminis]|uniref:SRPBCC family protein n=1 Tax=Aquibacillus sediminis TaxID=2574734 RepID=UPI001109CB34|nr:SRPBCC family protein [Aquibacillus sediminis]
MSKYGTLHKKDGRYALRFERFFDMKQEDVFSVITDPNAFTQWYPFATGDMDLQVGGEIGFDDGEGSTYEGVITELTPPHTFVFREVDDWIQMTIQPKDHGCEMVFTHTFDDKEMIIYVAAGWHRCLDALGQIVKGQQVQWQDNASELREYYKDAFDLN